MWPSGSGEDRVNRGQFEPPDGRLDHPPVQNVPNCYHGDHQRVLLRGLRASARRLLSLDRKEQSVVAEHKRAGVASQAAERAPAYLLAGESDDITTNEQVFAAAKGRIGKKPIPSDYARGYPT
jgi:hypothetical protein